MNDHEALLRRVITGDLDPDAPEFRHACRDAPELGDRFAGLREVQGRLDAAGQYAVESPSAETRSAELEFERRFRSRLGRPGKWRAAWVPATAAAAVLVVAILVATGRDADPAENSGRDQLPLGGESLPIPNRYTSQARFDRFEWGHLPFDSTHTYRLTIYRDETRLESLAPPVDTREKSWRPDPAVEATWPDRIYYLLEVFDASDARVKPLSARAERSR